jgi:hypothetical protein
MMQLSGLRPLACSFEQIVWRPLERSFAWLSCYRRLNTIFERSKDHLIAFVAIAFISILARHLKRLVAKELSARRLQTATKSAAFDQRPFIVSYVVWVSIGIMAHPTPIGCI